MVQSHTYDSLNRLQSTTETYNGGQQSWQQTYSYDRFGNRRFDMSQTSFPNLTQGAAKVFNPEIDGATNRLKEQQDGDGALDYDYDATGNLTRDAEGKLFAYDAEGHQRSFGTGGSQSNGAQYHYDGQGKRVRKVVGGVVTLFIYDSFGQLAAEYENTTPQPNGTRFITADHLGSPRVVTDGAGAVVSRHDYMAFGEELYAGTGSRTLDDKYSASDHLRKQYTGYERDAESGLDFAQARYYNSRHGRFTSPDPLTASATIRDPQSFNRYSYALNSPYKFTDPLGLLSMYTTGANGHNWDLYGLGGGALQNHKN